MVSHARVGNAAERHGTAHVRRKRVWSIGVAIVAAGLIGVATTLRSADAHPLHTTWSELTVAADGTVRIVLRAFADDLSAAVMRASARTGVVPTPPDSAIARYLGEAMLLTDASGRTASLVVTETRRTGDLVWVTLHAPRVRVADGPRLTNRVLFERWDDQVNIVQTTVGSRRRTLLFTRRDIGVSKPI